MQEESTPATAPHEERLTCLSAASEVAGCAFEASFKISPVWQESVIAARRLRF